MPSTMRDRLLAAAAVRTSAVLIGDETFYVREVSANKFSKYGELMQKDRPAAMVFLLQECVIDEEGNPCLSVEDAAIVADSARVGLTLLTAVMKLSGYAPGEDEPPGHPDAD